MTAGTGSFIAKRTIHLGPVAVDYAIDAGPRILGYARHGGPQLFASLPTQALEHPAIGKYRLLGGHRLWRAPERPAITYAPDDGAKMAVTEFTDGLSISGAPEPDGLTKTISLTQRGQYTVVDHELHNQGPDPVRCAPWAITQLATGGVAILPQTQSATDPDGVLPNRYLVAWPYTDWSHPEIEFLPDSVHIHGSDRPYPTKVGQPNQRGWIAYSSDGEIFIKWTTCNDDSNEYVDFGATMQCYRDQRFVEIETLGALSTLEPGQKTLHREIWLLFPAGDEPTEELLSHLPSYPEFVFEEPETP
jgi:hypothetical protein